MQKYVKIEGMYCDECKKRITNALLKNKNITKVKIKNGIATLACNEKAKNKDIIKAINDLDYFTKEEYIKDNNEFNTNIKLTEFLIISVSIILATYLINKIFGYNVFNVIPNINNNITYGMLFITGLLTSIHCISMCGAINLVAIYSNKNNFKKPLLFNLGRLISYTFLGGLVGLLGKVIEFNNTFRGIIIIGASVIMFLLSLKMLGIIDFKLLNFHKNNKSNNSFIIGLLNGLMPCGPLQAMQIYALSTGSFIKGAVSMFLFCLGTIPLMLSVGIVYNILKGKGKLIINKIASILILLLSLVMLNRGLLSLNIDLFKNKDYGDYTKTTITDNIQVIEFSLEYNNYKDIIVQKNLPVRIIINVDEKYLTGCNNEIIMKDFNINKKLEVGVNVIEFTPSKEGVYTYTCWMNMIKNNIKVIDDINYFKK